MNYTTTILLYTHRIHIEGGGRERTAPFTYYSSLRMWWSMANVAYNARHSACVEGVGVSLGGTTYNMTGAVMMVHYLHTDQRVQPCVEG